MIYYDADKRKWVDTEESSGWVECLFGAVLFVLFLTGLLGEFL